MNQYTVVGYDKDNDGYEVLYHGLTYAHAISMAKWLGNLVKQGKLRRKDTKGEPIDWIEVYESWDSDYEKRVWVSA